MFKKKKNIVIVKFYLYTFIYLNGLYFRRALKAILQLKRIIKRHTYIYYRYSEIFFREIKSADIMIKNVNLYGKFNALLTRQQTF